MCRINNLFILSLMLGLLSCAKTEGVGGGGHVKAKVLVKRYNALGTLLSEYYAQNKRMYIIYGDDDFKAYDDRTFTSYDGSFEFMYLKKGYYTVFTYSKCVTCPSGQDSTVFSTFRINEKNEVIELSDLIVRG
jgi:hypothetical protein